MQILTASQMADGKKLYIDFWEWTQPIVYWLLQAIASFASLTHLQPGALTTIILFSLLVLSNSTAFFLMKKTDESIRGSLLPLILGVSFTALLTRFDFGCLQYVLLIALAPWMVLRFRSHFEQETAIGIRIAIGLFAGLAMCFDVPFLFIFLLIETTFLLNSTKWKALLKPEIAAFCFPPLIYLVCLAFLNEPTRSLFWQCVLPLRIKSYAWIDESIYFVMCSPNRADIVAVSAWAVVVSLAMSFLIRETARRMLLQALATLVPAGLLLWMVEEQGFSAQLLLTEFAATSIFLYAIFESYRSLTTKLSLQDRDPEARTENGAAEEVDPESRAERARDRRLPAGFLNAAPFTNKKVEMAASVFLVFFACIAVSWSLDRDRQLLADDMVSLQKQKKRNFYEELKDEPNAAPVALFCEPPGGTFQTLLASNRQQVAYLRDAKVLRMLDELDKKKELTGEQKEFNDAIRENCISMLKQSPVDYLYIRDRDFEPLMSDKTFCIALDENFIPECIVHAINPSNYKCNRQPNEFCGYIDPLRKLKRRR